MNKLKTFSDFEKHISGDHSELINKVQIIGESDNTEKSPFNRIDSFDESDGGPILICNNISMINESSVQKEQLYNSYALTNRNNKLSKFIGESFIPKTVKNRKNVKRLNFPITAIGKNGTKNVYETYSKFKKSENYYHTFQEKPVPKTKYEVLFFKNEPIHATEKINENGRHKKINSDFKTKLTHISDSIMKKHKLDVYCMNITESLNDTLFLRGLKKCSNMSESQANVLYVKLYEDYYQYNLPFWFKNKMNYIDDNS